MKKFLVLASFLILNGQLVFSQLLFKLTSDSLLSYSYSGGDEFNQNKLDENYWHNGLGWTRVLMSQDLAFSPDYVKQNNGLIYFKADKKDSVYVLNPYEIDSSYWKKEKLDLNDNKFLTKYSVGCIISKQKFHYGVYELRFKVEEGRGVWPAFWFFGGNKNEEIDAFELKCERNNQIHVDTHCPSGCDHGYKDKFSISQNWGNWMPVSDYLHKGFNIMHLEWGVDHVLWYINGYPLAYFKGSFSNPMNLYLNTSVAKDGGAFKPGPDKTTQWPNNYAVDYFRVWNYKGPSEKLNLKTNDDLVSSNVFESTYQIKPLKKRGLTYKKTEFNSVSALIYLSLSSKNKLTMRITGKLTEARSEITLLVGTTKTIITEFNKDLLVDIPSSESEITLLLKDNDLTFQKKIQIQR